MRFLVPDARHQFPLGLAGANGRGGDAAERHLHIAHLAAFIEVHHEARRHRADVHLATTGDLVEGAVTLHTLLAGSPGQIDFPEDLALLQRRLAVTREETFQRHLARAAACEHEARAMREQEWREVADRRTCGQIPADGRAIPNLPRAEPPQQVAQVGILRAQRVFQFRERRGGANAPAVPVAHHAAQLVHVLQRDEQRELFVTLRQLQAHLGRPRDQLRLGKAAQQFAHLVDGCRAEKLFFARLIFHRGPQLDHATRTLGRRGRRRTHC